MANTAATRSRGKPAAKRSVETTTIEGAVRSGRCCTHALAVARQYTARTAWYRGDDTEGAIASAVPEGGGSLTAG